jgi:hypothetical protein
MIYALCALTSLACLVLLWRSYAATASRLLFWSALCFLFLAANNVLLVIDKVIDAVTVDLTYWRLGAGLLAVLLLLYGLIGEE